MRVRSLSRNRIRGVSFHHGRSATGSGQRMQNGILSANAFAWNGPSLLELRKTAPTPFSDTDFKRLMGDQGRQEIHTRVSDAVEQLGHLKQLSQSLVRFLPESEPGRETWKSGEDEKDDYQLDPLRELAVEVTRLQLLWKIHLDMLEMVVMAQNSLRRWPSGR